MGSRPKKLVSPPPGPPGPNPAVKPVAAASLHPNAQKYLSFVAQLNTQFRSQMWKVFVDESADAILLLDQDLRCAFVNRTLEQMCGHTSDEVLGLTLDELPVNFLTPEFAAGARRALVSGASSEFDIECQQEAGSTQHRRIRLIPEVDTQARVLGVLCIAKDITEFKEAERKLGAAQLIANISYWEWDYRTDTLTGTRLGREVLGLSGDSLTAEEYNDMIPEAERETINALYERAFEQGLRDISYEHGLVFEDGSRKEMQNWVRLEYGADGRAIRAIGVTQDVTRMIALQRETHQLAFYDPLTKLPNRTLLHDKLQKALDEATAKQRKVGLIML
jgi:PAS domain S-box-containing protein